MKYLAVVLLLIVPSTALAVEPPEDLSLPAIESAGSDARGRITVNGKPFFPILMYDVPVDADSLKMFHDHGFNVLSARVEDAGLLRKHGFYTAAHGGDSEKAILGGVLFGVGMDSPALYWKDDLLEKSRADLAATQKSFPNRPIFHAVGYWEDEPEGVFAGKLPRKERYEELVKVLDVAAPYLYPLPYQPVRSVGEAVERANAATKGRKPVLPVLQLFVWKPEDAYPTPAELGCMAYLALIHGADGIGYYSYNYVTGKPKTNIAQAQPELWKSVKALNAEIRQAGEFLLESEREPAIGVTADPAVESRAAAKGDQALLLVANTSPETQSVKIRWVAKSAMLESIGEGKKVTVVNGAAELRLGPMQAVGLRGER